MILHFTALPQQDNVHWANLGGLDAQASIDTLVTGPSRTIVLPLQRERSDGLGPKMSLVSLVLGDPAHDRELGSKTASASLLDLDMQGLLRAVSLDGNQFPVAIAIEEGNTGRVVAGRPNGGYDDRATA